MKRSLTAILAGGAVFGATVAFAATLTVDGNNLASGSNTDALNAACSAVTLDYDVAWTGTYHELTDVRVSDDGTSSCSNESVEIVLLGADGDDADTDPDVLGTAGPTQLTTGTTTFDVSSQDVDSAAVTQIAVVAYTAITP